MLTVNNGGVIGYLIPFFGGLHPVPASVGVLWGRGLRGRSVWAVSGQNIREIQKGFYGLPIIYITH